MRRVPTLRFSIVLTCWTLLFPLAPTGQASTDSYLRTEASDVLSTTPSTATATKFKDSPAVKRTIWQTIGTWSAPPLTSALRLEAVGDLHVWLGLKNSDDQGTYFDLRAELRKNGSVIASGETKTIQGVTRNPSLAKEVTVAFGALSTSEFNPGDVLSLKILTKVADSGGHSNAVGLRLYYDAVARPSRVGITFGPAAPPSPTITITAPQSGSVLNQPAVLVRGRVTGPTEVGVTINGLVAAVSGDQFAALVPVDESVSQLTAIVTAVTGVTASATVDVTVQASDEAPVLLRALPAGGVAPLTVGFSLSSLVPVAQVALDLEGNGSIDFQDPSLDGQGFVYSAPGLYLPTAQVTDPQGRVYTGTTVLQVYDVAALDAALQVKWQGLKDALRTGDVARAATFLHSDTRTAYQSQFARFSATTLANIDQYMTSIQLVEVGFGGAQYEMLRQRDGQTLSFAVWFQLDQDGLWRLRRF